MAELTSETFYVYENWTHNKTRIHRGTCSHCNNGDGHSGGISEGGNDKWHGAFSSYADAKKCAQRLGRADNADCEFCQPC